MSTRSARLRQVVYPIDEVISERAGRLVLEGALLVVDFLLIHGGVMLRGACWSVSALVAQQ